MPNSYAAITTKKFLDADGLTYFSQKLNEFPTNDVIAAVIEGTQDALDEKVDTSDVGAASGVASLDSSGKVPSSQLPASANTTYTLTQSQEDGHIIIFTPSIGSATQITIPDNNTTYTEATTVNAGLMSASDKSKLDGIATSATNTNVSYDTTNKKITKSVNGVSSDIVTVATIKTDLSLTKSDVGLGNVDNTSDANKPISTATQAALDGKLSTTLKGVANGLAELDANGLVPSSQLPSYVDDVLEYATRSSFPATGETGKIYVDLATNLTYRWGGSGYVEISQSLALGTTSSTAFRGDYGNTAYSHAQAKGSAYVSGLYKITTNDEGHVTAATAVVKADITGLGIPGSDTNTHRPIQVNGTQVLGDNTTALNLKAGSNVSMSNDSGTVTINATDTTYSNATTSAAGLMSADDKTKLDGVAAGATANVGTITGITMNGASKGTSGNVDLGTVITAHQDISGKADKTATVSTVAYDTTNKKITKTINGTTSDVVTASTLKTDMGLANVENKSSATIRGELTSSNVTTALGFTPLDAAKKGAANGVAELGSDGKVPAAQLPAYVDDVLEYNNQASFPTTGETGKIYVALDNNKTYRWSGTAYIEISASLALGTTSSTAYRGDYGNAAYTHAVTNKGAAFSSGLYKITTNAEGHVTAATAVVKADITSLGIPAQDTTYNAISDAQIDALFA